MKDLGRYQVTGRSQDVGAFRTPSLLGVRKTAPYMHTGLFGDLDNVLRFYNAGGANPRPRADLTSAASRASIFGSSERF